ncbi:MAG: carbohydrate kinase [Armatimonadetes bacterium]|nr:carbohydrate kinase [Armatimonadota bacterium]MDI9586063.1 PfkB family carbohydrate kinase [Acidobacteriota bacterium]
MTSQRMEELLAGFSGASIAVIGDFFLDKYLILEERLTEVSVETGLDAYQVVARRLSPGAAGTVTNNLTALEAGEVFAVGFTGDDGEGFELRQGLARTGVDMTALLRRPDQVTPTYTKPMLRDNSGVERELNRLDIKNRQATPPDLEDAILENLRALLPRVQAVIIADQVEQRDLGVITDRVRDAVAKIARENPEVHFLADSRANIGLFREVMIKPNKIEAARSCGFTGTETGLSAEDARRFGTELAARNHRPAFVTAGPEGILVFDGDSVTHVPGIASPPPIDIVGAGDSCTSGIVLAMCAGASPREAAVVGNCVASLTVQQIGTTGTTTRSEVLRRFQDHARLFESI